jgi:hypothetical protein
MTGNVTSPGIGEGGGSEERSLEIRTQFSLMPSRIKSMLKDVEIFIPGILLVMMEGNQGCLQIHIEPFH